MSTDPTTDQPDQPDQPDLTPILGVWRTEGEVLGDDGETVVATFSGTDAYERLGAAFVIHRADVDMSDGTAVRGLEMIGPWDPDDGSFATCNYDGGGGIERSTTRPVDGGGLTFGTGGGDERGEAVLRPDPDGRTMRGTWRRTEDGGVTWRPWMRLHLTRVGAG